MESSFDLLIGIGGIIVAVLILRAFGAWMLRIDEVIDVQKEILNELKKSNSSQHANQEKQVVNQ